MGCLIDLILLPFTLFWKLIGIIFALLGKILTAGIGLILMIIGIILCITVIALPLGIVFIIFGFSMAIRGIF